MSTAVSSIELQVGGMTCASCATRIEKKLNRLDGVSATVNYATEKATATVPDGFDTALLIAEVEKAGYSAVVPVVPPPREISSAGSGDSGGPSAAQPDPELTSLRTRLVVSAVLAAPVVVLAMVPVLQFTYWQWASLVLAAPVVVWGAWPFHRAAWINLRHGGATMDTLVSIGTIAAFAWSLYALFLGTAGMPGMRHGFELTLTRADGASQIYLEVAAGVTVFVLAGRYIEKRSKRAAGAALRALLELGAKDVSVLRDGVESRMPVARLRVGDRFVVRPGEKIATDGVVASGTSAIDTSTFTGEPVPVGVGADDPVIGGAVNVGGRLVVTAARVGADTQLAQMARLVEEAQSGKAQVQRLADRVSAVFVPIVIALAALALAAWLIAGFPPSAAFTAAVAVLVIACPCALGLATPTALLVGTGRGAQLGILIRGPEVLESTRRVDTIVLDKTGTVTEGRMRLLDVVTEPGTDRRELLRLAGALEDASEHPIAQAVAKAAVLQVGTLAAVEGFVNLPGRGVQGVVDSHAVVVGRASLLDEWALQPSRALTEAKQRAEADGMSVVTVGWDGAARGILVVADTVKPTSALAIAGLKRLGLTPVLLTGDNAAAARRIAAQVGIDEVVAEVLPAQKAEVVARLRRQGRVVAMAGDGVNDAPALATADLGMAMGTGADVAIEASDVTLVRGDLLAAVDAIRLSRATLRTIRSNLFWAFAYNVAALPIAAFGLLNPMFAGAAMALSSVFVVGNSLRLRRFASVERTTSSQGRAGSIA
jgi:Cu+-exporting ATPase